MLLQLFVAFLQVGLFSVGGGYAAFPLIRDQAVELHHWITMQEFTDLVTFAEMTPGPMALNAATFVGSRLAGLPGALAATLGCILPSLIIVNLLAWVYFRWRRLDLLQDTLSALRPAVVALIASAGLSVLLQVLFGSTVIQFDAFRLQGAVLFGLSLYALRKWKPSPVLIIFLCGAAGLCISLVTNSIS